MIELLSLRKRLILRKGSRIERLFWRKLGARCSFLHGECLLVIFHGELINVVRFDKRSTWPAIRDKGHLARLGEMPLRFRK